MSLNSRQNLNYWKTIKTFNIIQDNLEIIIGGEEDSNDREIVEKSFFIFKSKLLALKNQA